MTTLVGFEQSVLMLERTCPDHHTSSTTGLFGRGRIIYKYHFIYTTTTHSNARHTRELIILTTMVIRTNESKQRRQKKKSKSVFGKTRTHAYRVDLFQLARLSYIASNLTGFD